MIKSKDVNKELKVIDETARLTKDDAGNVRVVVLKGILKALGLAVKLIRDIRTNQVRIMEKYYKIDLVQENDSKE